MSIHKDTAYKAKEESDVLVALRMKCATCLFDSKSLRVFFVYGQLPFSIRLRGEEKEFSQWISPLGR